VVLVARDERVSSWKYEPSLKQRLLTSFTQQFIK
jgi:hypothetical protein